MAPRLFLICHDPDAAEDTLGHESDEANIGFVEGVVPGGSSGRIQPAIEVLSPIARE
jgi:hypothetical protein